MFNRTRRVRPANGDRMIDGKTKIGKMVILSVMEQTVDQLMKMVTTMAPVAGRKLT